MVWEHLEPNKPHLVYIVLGGFTTLFMLCSSVIKERFYIGEATVATICGIIFGPHAANVVDPMTWGNTDQITLEFSRIVLVVQCFAVGVELPKAYMERHWRSVTFLLVPVMTFGWLITSLFIWWMVPMLNWLDSLCVAACVTATDPVLASSVVGKGKFAKRVPKHLRDLLSAESGCNDGMAFPFIYLAIYLIRYRPHTNEVALHWFCYTILYECIFGAIYGVAIGYIARRLIRYSHERDLIDRESFLVFYFVLALFCAGSGSILGMDDLLIGFACGVGFSNDGWFLEKTEESHVSNVIDLLINLAFFVYFGTIIPWAQYNSEVIGLVPWRLVVIAIFVLLFRRIPIMVALKPVIPDLKTWREALFAGHFGPIGVGAIFVAILARAELETESTTPLAVLPEPGFEHLNIIELIWPITTFLVICSIIVHGSSIAVFTLGKHINTLTLTMSYTQGVEEGPTWMDRLPRIQSRSRTSMSRESEYSEKDIEYPPGAQLPGNFLRRQKEGESEGKGTGRASSRSRNRSRGRKKNWDSGRGPGGPISQSAIHPQARNKDHSDVPQSGARKEDDVIPIEKASSSDNEKEKGGEQEPEAEIYMEGKDAVVEDEQGNVLDVIHSNPDETEEEHLDRVKRRASKDVEKADVHHGHSRREEGATQSPGPEALEKIGSKIEEGVEKITSGGERPKPQRPNWRDKKAYDPRSYIGRRKEPVGDQPAKAAVPESKKGTPALAYQYGNTVIVEDESGEVIKQYNVAQPKRPSVARQGTATSYMDPHRARERLGRMGTYLGMGRRGEEIADAVTEPAAQAPSDERRKKSLPNDEDDDRVRFTITSGGRRMSKAEFLQQIGRMDPKARAKVVEQSDAPEAMKEEARADADEFQQEQAQEARQSRRKSEYVAPLLDSRRKSAAVRDSPGESSTSSSNTPGTDSPNLEADEEPDAAVRKVDTTNSAAGPDGLQLVDSNNEQIPFHSITGDLARFSLAGSPGGETAAQRRRRMMSPVRERGPEEEDSDDDGTERVPPASGSGSGSKPRELSPDDEEGDEEETPAERRRREQAFSRVERSGGSTTTPSTKLEEQETEAERRRREGALGVRSEESDSEEEGDERVPAQPRGIRFADQVSPTRERREREEAEGEPSAQGSGSGGGQGGTRHRHGIGKLRWGGVKRHE